MMPDLGTYATEVLSAYGISLTLLAGIVWRSWRRAVRVRATLRAVEGERHDG